MDMLQLYESMLNLAGFIVNKDGTVSIRPAPNEKVKQPMTIKGKRLVIPTREQMTAPDWAKRVVFHPLAENALKGETEVFGRYRFALNQQINIVLPALMVYLLDIAASPAQHKTMTPQQTEYLLELSEVDEKTVENFRKLLTKIPVDDANKSFVSIYMKRNGEVNKRRYPRAAIVSFPIYKQLCETEDNNIEGVKLRVKDVKAYKALLEYMIPGIEDADTNFNSGSDSKIAPYTVALMSSISKLVNCINDVTNAFFDEGSANHSAYSFRTDWVDLISDLTPILNQIRMTPSQEPVESEETVAPASTAPLQNFNSPVQAAQPTQPVQQPTVVPTPQPAYVQPVAQPVAQPAQSSGGVTSVDAILAAKFGPQAAMPQQVVYAQPGMVQPVYGQPAPVVYPQAGVVQPVYGQPVYGQPVYTNAAPVTVGSYGYPVKG